MAPSKKRAAPTQGSTLFDFFGGQNHKSCSPSKKTKSETEVESLKHNGRLNCGSTAADAIVIDDEEDLATSTIPRKAKISETAEKSEGLSFGLPSLLMSSPPQVEVRQEFEPETNGNNTSKAIEDDCLTEFVEVGGQDDFLNSAEKVDSLNDDEWALGDDETVNDNGDGYEDDADTTLVEEPNSYSGTCEKACPLCGAAIVGMSSSVSTILASHL